jgi:hypothetical protein
VLGACGKAVIVIYIPLGNKKAPIKGLCNFGFLYFF